MCCAHVGQTTLMTLTLQHNDVRCMNMHDTQYATKLGI